MYLQIKNHLLPIGDQSYFWLPVKHIEGAGVVIWVGDDYAQNLNADVVEGSYGTDLAISCRRYLADTDHKTLPDYDDPNGTVEAIKANRQVARELIRAIEAA